MAGSRFPSIRTSGEGYETEGREYSDHLVQFVYDYSDFSATAKSTRQAMSDFGNDIYKLMSGMETNKSGFIYASNKMPNMMTVDGALQKVISLYADDKQIGNDLVQFAKNTADVSKSTIKYYIGSRVETGTMKGSVYGRTKRGKNKVTATAGWIDLWYKYFSFQEEGTSQVRPMHAMMRTYLEIAPWVQKGVSKYLRGYTRGEGFKG